MDALLANKRAQYDDLVSKLQTITERAAKENRDLSDGDQKLFDEYKVQIEEVTGVIRDMTDLEKTIGQAAKDLADVTGADGRDALFRAEQSHRTVADVFPTPGHYLSDFIAVRRGEGAQKEAAEQRMREGETILRAVENQTTTDNPGILADAVVGPLVSKLDRRRAAWSSFTFRRLTAHSMFRPVITQHTQVGQQTAEKAELPSRKMTIEKKAITPVTIGGVVDISIQDILLTRPEILDVVIDDLRGQAIVQAESLAATQLDTIGKAAKLTALADLKPATVQTGIYAAAAKVFAAVGSLPDHVAMSPDVWAILGGLADTAGRPIFPSLAPMNAPGRMAADTLHDGPVYGLTPVVSAGLPAKSLIVYSSQFLEAYEQVIGVLRVTEPRLVGVEVAWAALAAVVSLDATSAVQIPLPAGS